MPHWFVLSCLYCILLSVYTYICYIQKSSPFDKINGYSTEYLEMGLPPEKKEEMVEPSASILGARRFAC